jgi:Flagellar basal body-associated protein
MNKKLIITIAVVLVVAVAVYLYFFALAKPPEKEYSYYEPGDYFVTNIKDSTSLIKVTIVLELYTYKSDLEEITEYLKQNNHVIRDIIVFTLRSKTEEELRSQDIAETLRKEVVQRIDEQMGIDYISTIYFNDYVVQ